MAGALLLPAPNGFMNLTHDNQTKLDGYSLFFSSWCRKFKMSSTFWKAHVTQKRKHLGPLRRSRISQLWAGRAESSVLEVGLSGSEGFNMFTSSCLVTAMRNGLFSFLSCPPGSQVLTWRTDITVIVTAGSLVWKTLGAVTGRLWRAWKQPRVCPGLTAPPCPREGERKH